jgi:uncharacterized membrane protein YdfJ with MMPL/SSD domain
MTPLVAFLARVMPRPLVLPALISLYAAMMLGLVLFAGSSEIDIAYVDVGLK